MKGEEVELPGGRVIVEETERNRVLSCRFRQEQ